MSQTLHRSQNLIIARGEEPNELTIEIRFPTSMARGHSTSDCPRCGVPGVPEQWEIEGPDGRSNLIWLGCAAVCSGKRDTRWSRTVTFDDGWTEID